MYTSARSTREVSTSEESCLSFCVRLRDASASALVSNMAVLLTACSPTSAPGVLDEGPGFVRLGSSCAGVLLMGSCALAKLLPGVACCVVDAGPLQWCDVHSFFLGWGVASQLPVVDSGQLGPLGTCCSLMDLLLLW